MNKVIMNACRINKMITIPVCFPFIMFFYCLKLILSWVNTTKVSIEKNAIYWCYQQNYKIQFIVCIQLIYINARSIYTPGDYIYLSGNRYYPYMSHPQLEVLYCLPSYHLFLKTSSQHPLLIPSLLKLWEYENSRILWLC